MNLKDYWERQKHSLWPWQVFYLVVVGESLTILAVNLLLKGS